MAAPGEMEILLAAGLTPMEVIEASSCHAAQACGQGGELGTLERGKLAEGVRVALVIKNGEIGFISE